MQNVCFSIVLCTILNIYNAIFNYLFVDFILDESVKSAVEQAQNNFKQVSSNLDLNVLLYDQLHRDLIKNYKLSPDSVAQLGFQVISFLF